MVRTLLLTMLTSTFFSVSVSTAGINRPPAAVDPIWDVLGLKLEVVGATAVKEANPNLDGGMRVLDIQPASPAFKLLRKGDILVGLGKWKTTNHAEVLWVVNYVQQEKLKTLRFYVIRDGKVRYGDFQFSPKAVGVTGVANGGQR
jgi:serine protease Do